ncbi:MAG: PBSX family phage terminase large subunit [Ignavibacteriae bacterium]|nr:PBSX family phage terminase large subunit [Ignavibacteriota bacterium]
MEHVTNEITFHFMLSNFNSCFVPLIEKQNRYLFLYGGAGSGKSIFAGQKLLFRALKETNHKFLLIRKVARTIRGSQFSLLKSLIDSSNLREFFYIRESDLSIICNLNGNTFISAGMDDREKIKSIHGITSVWIEEATELNLQDFRQIDLRLRGKTNFYKQIILTYNPVDALHWLNTIQLKNCLTLKTTYKDNKFIDPEYFHVLESLKDQDPEYYKIYAKGEWGIKRNIIYSPFEILKEYPSAFQDEIYGLDFGFNNPTAFIHIGIYDNQFYLSEKIYKSKLTTSDLISSIHSSAYQYPKKVYCDSAEPGKIQELKNARINAYPSEKSVKDGIDYIKSLKIYSKDTNNNINKEVLSYSYSQDKNGNLLDDPVKFNDHCLDAIRYALFTHRHTKSTPKPQILWL